MKLVDLNVLLYAVNRDSHHHRAVLDWWNIAMNGYDTIGLPWVVLLGFLRISTNPRVFARPLAVDEAIAQVNTWLSRDNVRVLGEGDNHWNILQSLIAEAGAAGNLTTDAHLAAIAIGHGAVLVSCDSDFGRFKGLRWENPSG
ncbi:MAG: type II toxin-antitoxin system VapC family toxin [Candidatus Competibacterales bacterium]|nr:type II toxin-antitoxin system VapC family toxin [Candidatus Competibacterales bacterium]